MEQSPGPQSLGPRDLLSPEPFCQPLRGRKCSEPNTQPGFSNTKNPRRAPLVSTVTGEVLTPDPCSPARPRLSRRPDQHGEGQPGSAAAAARPVLGAAGPVRPSPATTARQLAARTVARPRRGGRILRPVPLRPRATRPRPRGGAQASGRRRERLREGTRPSESPAVRITGVGRRSRVGPADLRGGGRRAEVRPQGGRQEAGV